ncbi:nitrate reductase [Marinobacter nanhaiticus D15-8W]|uniref:nitrate reductase n=1 Tax=Marinobacter nanhaiticus TaxID=1305740 RepID=UPI0002CC2A48|nr:nitrate reductase [Marinobacter nanhaiticus]BES69267.1 nitrate reductase [Marinobacter nanhaiticus D15-8W]
MNDKPNKVCKTTCPYCGVGCGVEARDGAPVLGDRQHPANFGRLCVKGSSLHETLGETGRLLYPKINRQRVAWSQAISAVADAVRASIARYGTDSVAFYLSGQLLTEDYYVANKLAKGFLGTPHVDTNSRLCMSSAVAAHKRAFGADVVPGCYEDLELADLLVLVGSNAAWNHPILYQRMKDAARDGRKVVVIDPRQTATSELADIHLSLKPGSDALLFNGLLSWLASHDALDQDYIERHCSGFQGALEAAGASAPSLEAVAEGCDLAVADVERFFRWFAETARTVTVFSQGVNQSSSGTDKGNAIINCHLATGRVGKPGASPFSITGQPNAMGGREVGGLANTLAAHMNYETPGDAERVAHFWDSPGLANGPGYKAVDLFDAVHRGQIKVLWIMATNPAVSLPNNARVREALARCPTVIVSDCTADTDTAAYADILLPAAGWGEKDGTVTNSERRISRQRRFLPLAGEARPDWWIMSSVARELGYGDAFDYNCPADIFREHARLSAFENTARPFDLGGLSGLSNDQYESLEPIQWPVNDRFPSGRTRIFDDGQFATTDGRAGFVAIQPQAPVTKADTDYPMIVNSGRIRDQWHTMTRTGRAARLWQHRAEPFIDVHPNDLEKRGLNAGQLGRLQGPAGEFIGRIQAVTEQREGEVFIPIHWNQQFSAQALASDLMAAVVDPVSGQPESKHGVARLEAFEARWEARLLCRPGHTGLWQADQWSKVPLDGCESWWLAGKDEADWSDWAARWLGGTPQLEMSDAAAGRYRAARFHQGRLLAVLIAEPAGGSLPDLAWLAQCFTRDELTAGERRAILAGRDAEQPDIGPVVCSCFQVGEKQIDAAIRDGADSVDALGAAMKCGTNCGSCVPELKKRVEQARIDDLEAAGK